MFSTKLSRIFENNARMLVELKKSHNVLGTSKIITNEPGKAKRTLISSYKELVQISILKKFFHLMKERGLMMEHTKNKRPQINRQSMDNQEH